MALREVALGIPVEVLEDEPEVAVGLGHGAAPATPEDRFQESGLADEIPAEASGKFRYIVSKVPAHA